MKQWLMFDSNSRPGRSFICLMALAGVCPVFCSKTDWICACTVNVNHLLRSFSSRNYPEPNMHRRKNFSKCLVYFSAGGTCCVLGLYFIRPISPPASLMDYPEIVIYLHNCVDLMCVPCSFCARSVRIGSEAPCAYFGFCGSHFCGTEVLRHKEHIVFTILFFPGLERGLEPEQSWPSVALNFLLVENMW